MKLEAINAPCEELNTPLVARFATIRYDLPSEGGRERNPGIHASIPLTIFEDDTSPTTYSATTKHGDDNDSDDTGSD